MSYKSLTIKTNVNDHAIDLAIVDFLGLGSVLDIMEVTKVGTRYEIFLEDGTKKFASVNSINDIVNQVKTSVAQVGTTYTITNRFNRFNGITEFTMVDRTGHIVKHIERYPSTIYKSGMMVTVNDQRQIGITV